MAARYLGVSALAAAVTFGLFWLMQALIGVEGQLLDDKKRTVIDFVRLKRESERDAA